MYQNKRILGLIPARGGSVGLPGKNVALLAGKPLVAWTIEAAARSKYLDAIYCSTNDAKIAQATENTGVAKVLWRPDELCTSTAKTIDCVVHAIETLKEQGELFDYVMLLQPTSPLRQTFHIDGIIEHVINNDLPTCVSVHEMHELPILMRYISDKSDETIPLLSVLGKNSTVRRQDAKKTYYVDGVLYLHRTSDLSTKTSLNDASHGYIIDAEYAHDVHTYDDILECAEWLAKYQNDA
jgi:CMP-N-acetylneuraminic acid synthetase